MGENIQVISHARAFADKLEQLPQTWQVVQLKDLTLEGPSNGYSGPTSDTALGTKTLRLSATTQGFMVLNQETTKRLIEEIPKDSGYWLQPGDLLVQRSNTLEYLGATAIYEGEANQYVYPDLMMRLRFSDPATTRWVWRFLNSTTARRYFRKVAGGTAGSMPKISGAKLKDLHIPLPPLEEQRRIAAILDRADAVRRKRQEAIRLTEELLRSAFLEMFGDPVTNPKGWQLTRMSEIVRDTQYGTAEKSNSEGEGLPVLRMNNITYSGELDLRDLKWCPIAPADMEKYTVKRGDLLFNRTNSPELVGKTAVWRNDERYAYAGYLVRIRFKESLALPEYASSYLNSSYGKRYLLEKAKPSINMSNFSASEFLKIPLPLPPIELQHRFTAVADSIRTSTERLGEALSGSTYLFKSLLQQAFQGEL